MKKFEQKDLIAFMEDIVELNTTCYETDLDHDMVKLKMAIDSDDPVEKQLIWLCRSAGTWFFYERDVFYKGGPWKSAIRLYRDYKNLDQFLLFCFEITGKTYDGKGVLADIYVYDYLEFCNRLEQMAVETGPFQVFFEKGNLLYEDLKTIPDEHSEYGKYVTLDYTPKDPSQMKFVLTAEKNLRRKARIASMDRYISQLAKKREMPLPKNYMARKNALKEGVSNA